MRNPWLRGTLAVLLALFAWSAAGAVELEEARIYIEYNQSANDLGFHVALDGEDWMSLTITDPLGEVVFQVDGYVGYAELGMTELFFEGAEPTLDEYPLEDLLALFPEGEYAFDGVTVDGEPITGVAELSHAVPAAPEVRVKVQGERVTIRWKPVTGPAAILPDGEIEIAGYQVLVGDVLDVTLDADARKLRVPEEVLEVLEPGEVDFEVLAIDENGNQTIAEGSFFWSGDDDQGEDEDEE
jgi:hypothetical protein